MNFKIALFIVMATAGYAAYGLIAFFVDRSQMGGFLALNISMVTGTISVALRDMKFPNDPPADQAAPPALPAAPAVLPAPATTTQP